MGEPNRASSSSMVLPTIGRYRIIAQLGAGGMAEVYLAVMMGARGFNKLVVLKVPRSNVAANPGLLAMFIDEARVAARLNHPNVVQTYEVVREEERDIIVMEYLDGYPLSKIIGQGRKLGTPLPLWMHYEVLIHAMTGLHYAHEAKDFDGSPLHLVHRDISPHNIFVTFDRQVKILDFGIAKARTSTHQTEVGTFKGKVRYMPPEQLTGAAIDRRADIFALGAAIWEAAVGEPLWRGKSDIEVMGATLAGEVPMPRDVRADVPHEIDAICRRAMAHRKEDRYGTCLELGTDLEAYVSTMPGAKGLKPINGYMQMLFAEPRAERQALIERQLAKAELLGTGEFAAFGGSQPSGVSIPLIPAAARSESDPQLPVGNSLYPDLGSSAGGTVSRSRVTAAHAAGRSSKWGLLLLLLLLALAGVAAAWLFVLRGNGKEPLAGGDPSLSSTTGTQQKSTETPGAAPGTAAGAAAGAQARPMDVARMSLSLRAEPSTAKLFFDDAAVQTNPYALSMPKDGSTHSVRADAKGYVSKNITVTLDGDKEALLVLEREKADTTPWRPPPKGGKDKATPRETASVEAPKPAEPSGPNGFLTIDTYPWTVVSEGGKSLGQTPLVRVPLSPGDHTLVLENPEQGLKQTFHITIKSGETTNKRLGLK